MVCVVSIHLIVILLWIRSPIKWHFNAYLQLLHACLRSVTLLASENSNSFCNPLWTRKIRRRQILCPNSLLILVVALWQIHQQIKHTILLPLWTLINRYDSRIHSTINGLDQHGTPLLSGCVIHTSWIYPFLRSPGITCHQHGIADIFCKFSDGVSQWCPPCTRLITFSSKPNHGRDNWPWSGSASAARSVFDQRNRDLQPAIQRFFDLVWQGIQRSASIRLPAQLQPFVERAISGKFPANVAGRAGIVDQRCVAFFFFFLSCTVGCLWQVAHKWNGPNLKSSPDVHNYRPADGVDSASASWRCALFRRF